jgi:hypothetical protein
VAGSISQYVIDTAVSPWSLAVFFLSLRVLFFPWLGKAIGPANNFSPTAASLIAAPILSAVYFTLAMEIKAPAETLGGMIRRATLAFPPIFLILMPTFSIYVYLVFFKKISVRNIPFYVITVACVVMEVLWWRAIFGA